MLWSWWPWVAIITSASSNTNTLIFLGSMNFSLEHQSSTVPGVPMTICSEIFCPLSTAEREGRAALGWLCRQGMLWPSLSQLFHHLTALVHLRSIIPSFLFVVFPLTHVCCLGQRRRVSGPGKSFPSVQSLSLFEVPARMLGKGTNTEGTEGQ